ncbi:unnamed protein product [Ectocarpus fasciculatus]
MQEDAVDDAPSYRWEQGMARTWDQLQEDESGRIITETEDERSRSRLAKMKRVTKSIRRGLIRYTVLAVDASASLGEKDLKPSRAAVVRENAESFIHQFFDQNPISQLSLITTADRTASKLTDLSGNPKHHIQALGAISQPKGGASLQSVLIMANGILRHIPDYGHRELLLVYGSLSTCDAGDIFKTIEETVALKIRCSVICLSAEVHVCHRICQLTNGNFSLARDAHHFAELIHSHVTPPPELRSSARLSARFVFLGFPKRIYDAFPMCCYDGPRLDMQAGSSFQCPRCKVRNTQLPTQCRVCGLHLYSSSHIARSHHHMFPVPVFAELANTDGSNSNVPKSSKRAKLKDSRDPDIARCVGCNVTVGGADGACLRTVCPKCDGEFCVECDIFIHDSVHNCPGCCI